MIFQRSPCAVCRRFMIEHEGDPKDVLCGGCAMAVRQKRAEIAQEKYERTKPPPTTEWRHGQPYKRPRIEAIVLAIMAASFSLGFLVGFLVRGSV